MKTLLKFAVVALFAFIATTTAYAQEWTKAQLEVWQVVEDGWTKWKAGDLTGMMATVHDKYQGWSDDSSLPMSKEQVIQFYQEMKDMMKIDHFGLNPARIVVTENAAVVDYYFGFSGTVTMGDRGAKNDAGEKCRVLCQGKGQVAPPGRYDNP